VAKLNIIRRCYSCGVVLQSRDTKKEGYVENEMLVDLSKSVLFCASCFHSEKYNLSPREASLNPEFFTLIADAQATDALIVYVINLFSFEAGFIRVFNEWLKGLDILVIANKREIMPESSTDEHLKEYVSHRLRVEKLKVLDVVLLSTVENYNMREFIDKIRILRKRRDVYIIGQKHSGKTTIMEYFLKEYKNLSSINITTQNYPGTKMQVMRIPIDRTTAIYDTPGLGNDNSILEKVERSVARLLEPTKRIEKRTISINEDQTILVGGLARLELVEGERTMIENYFPSTVQLRKLISNEPNKFFLRNLEKGNVKPISKNLVSLRDFDIYDIHIDEEGPRDLGIHGLGWFTFIGQKQTLRLYVPKGVSFYTTRSKVKYGEK